MTYKISLSYLVDNNLLVFRHCTALAGSPLEDPAETKKYSSSLTHPYTPLKRGTAHSHSYLLQRFSCGILKQVQDDSTTLSLPINSYILPTRQSIYHHPISITINRQLLPFLRNFNRFC